MTPVMHRVAWARPELDDTVTLALEPVGPALSPPRPGQFNMLWAFGIGEAPISLASTGDGPLLHTIRRVGAVTNALGACGSGDVVGVRGPFGAGWNTAQAHGRDVLIVAGGLGVAPIRPIVEELFAHRADFARAVLLVGARAPDSLLYRTELEQWRSRLDIEVEVTVDTAPRSWRGDVGMVTRLIPRAPVEPERTTAFVCGPEVMMRFVSQSLVDLGVPPAHVQLSLERNMHCAVGHCGHCQLGPLFVCKDGPVLDWPAAGPLMRTTER